MIKSGAFLEELGRINAVAFDKTGTLTTGKPVVTDIVPAGGLAPEYVLHLAASAEKYSEHPLARAIQESAKAYGCSPAEPEGFNLVPGAGVESLVEGKSVCGRRKDLEPEGGLSQYCQPVPRPGWWSRKMAGLPAGSIFLTNCARGSGAWSYHN